MKIGSRILVTLVVCLSNVLLLVSPYVIYEDGEKDTLLKVLQEVRGPWIAVLPLVLFFPIVFILETYFLKYPLKKRHQWFLFVQGLLAISGTMLLLYLLMVGFAVADLLFPSYRITPAFYVAFFLLLLSSGWSLWAGLSKMKVNSPFVLLFKRGAA